MNSRNIGSRVYGLRELALAYLDALPGARVEFGEFVRDEYIQLLGEHRRRMLQGLQTLFGITLSEDAFKRDLGMLFHLFGDTAESCLALRTPWSNYLEAGGIFEALENAGPAGQQVRDASDRIDELVAQSRASHIDMLVALLRILAGDRADLEFTSSDLRELGIDDVPPDVDDYFISFFGGAAAGQ